MILQDADISSEIFGPHDQNLALIENLVGARILLRGNEILVDSDSDEVFDSFSRLFNELYKCVKNSMTVDQHCIQLVWDRLHSEAGDGFDDNFISIPHGFSKVFPRTMNQSKFTAALRRSEMVFGIGPAGTGKTFLAIAHALFEVLSHKKRKLVLTRPVIEAGESLGFLPGDLEQKLNPYMKPLYDAMEALVPHEILTRLEEQRLLEIAPLAYMRGRSLRESIIVLDEAQNTSREQMKMFLTRLGEGSRAVITGDLTQIDLPKPAMSGLSHAEKVLSGVDGIEFITFDERDVVRSGLVRRIIQAYSGWENSPESARKG